MSAHNCIVVKAAGLTIQHEGKAAAGTIIPGHIVAETAADTFALDARAATVGGPLLVAIEDPYLGTGLDTAYPINGRVYARALPAGSEFQGRLAPAAAAIVYNDSLSRDGAGGLKKASAADEIVAVALEAVNNSAGGTSVRIKCRAR